MERYAQCQRYLYYKEKLDGSNNDILPIEEINERDERLHIERLASVLKDSDVIKKYYRKVALICIELYKWVVLQMVLSKGVIFKDFDEEKFKEIRRNEINNYLLENQLDDQEILDERNITYQGMLDVTINSMRTYENVWQKPNYVNKYRKNW